MVLCLQHPHCSTPYGGTRLRPALALDELPDTLPSPLPAPPPAQLLPCCFLGLDFGTPTQPCGGFRPPLSPPGVSSSLSEPTACLSCSWT